MCQYRRKNILQNLQKSGKYSQIGYLATDPKYKQNKKTALIRLLIYEFFRFLYFGYIKKYLFKFYKF